MIVRGLVCVGANIMLNTLTTPIKTLFLFRLNLNKPIGYHYQRFTLLFLIKTELVMSKLPYRWVSLFYMKYKRVPFEVCSSWGEVLLCRGEYVVVTAFKDKFFVMAELPCFFREGEVVCYQGLVSELPANL